MRCQSLSIRAALVVALLLGSWLAPVRAGAEPPPAPPSTPPVASPQGGLILLGAPPRAAVMVDGQSEALTPLRAPLKLAEGAHKIQIKRAGYRPFEAAIQIPAERVIALEIDMPRIAGVLVVRSSAPASQVYLDGTPKGNAPLELEVSQGPHQVRVHRDGYFEDTFQFEAVLGEETTHEAQLRELPPDHNPYRKLEEKKPWYTRWWVWTLAAVGAAGIATAVIVPTVLSARSDCQRLDAEVCFPIQLTPSPAQMPAGLQIRF